MARGGDEVGWGKGDMRMSDESALLAAISANMDDDTPLLIYADWLDEHDRNDEATKIRQAISPLNADQWALIEKALTALFHREGNDTRILIGNFTYHLYVPLKTAKKGIVAAVQDRMKDNRREFVHKLTEEYREKCWKEWERVFQRNFGTRWAFQALGKVIREKIRERMTIRSVGVESATDLGYVADDIVLRDLVGFTEWRYVRPSSVDNLDYRLKEAILSFDPWSFDWSKCKLPPRVRKRMLACGFKFTPAASP